MGMSQTWRNLTTMFNFLWNIFLNWKTVDWSTDERLETRGFLKKVRLNAQQIRLCFLSGHNAGTQIKVWA